MGGIVKVIGVEYCEQCPYAEPEEFEEVTTHHVCAKTELRRKIPEQLFTDGFIPLWCPLEEYKQEVPVC